jgi:hypothetical protein
MGELIRKTFLKNKLINKNQMSFTWKPKSGSQGLRGKMGTLALPDTSYISKSWITGPQK